MSAENVKLLEIFVPFIVMLLITGFYYILATRNMIRILLGAEILTKAVTIAIVVVEIGRAHV